MPQPDDAIPLPLESLLLEYRIKSVRGSDGFGFTYLAQDTVLNKNVALKEYFPADLALRAMDGTVVPRSRDTEPNYRKGLAQFLVEARALARFAHPNIVPVDRYFEANGTAYMLREYEKGESILQRFAQAQRPDEATLKAIVAPLLDGLEAVHKAGVLHRDIKPGKIFIRDEGSPVLLEFGAARLASRDAIQDIIPILTPGYAPIEQYIRSGHQGPWSDIYSLAAVLFWAVTGEHPSDALSRLRMDTVPAMLTAVRSRYSAPFIAAIQWGLAVEENRRPQNVREWRGALLRGTPARTEDRTSAGQSADRQYVWMSLGILVFFLFVAGADILQHRAEERASRITKKSGAGQALAGAAAVSPLDASRSATTPGGLTREEVAQNLPHLADQFSQIDTDRSGSVSTEELQSYLRRAPPAKKR